ncbi:MAG: hypothetical protein HAW67_01750 [Endozoicomonadaceae bacterium]|nr:hypothetical protein [Endozoicomonadaceae bacterium]
MTAICKMKSSIEVVLHPSAKLAYDFVSSYPKLIDWSSLPPMLIEGIKSHHIFGVMHHELKESSTGQSKKIPVRFEFYTSLWQARYWENNRPPKETLLIDQQFPSITSKHEVEKSSWLSALQMLLFSVDTKNMVLVKDNLVKCIPKQILIELFGKNKITDNDFCDWASVTRGALVQQRERQKSTVKETTGTIISSLKKSRKVT